MAAGGSPLAIATFAAAMALSACTLISLDSLQGGPSGGNGASTSDGGNGASGASTSEGGNGAGHAGGAGGGLQTGGGGTGGGPAISYDDCILQDAPAVLLAMDGPTDEPNLGTLGGTGTYAGTFTFGAPIVSGSTASVTFDTSTSSSLSLPGAESLVGGFTPFTIEVWLRVPDTVENRDLVHFGTTADRVTLEMVKRSVPDGMDAFQLRVRDSAGSSRAVPYYMDLEAEAGNVHHLVGVYRQDSTTVFDQSGLSNDMVIYLDGALVTDVTGYDQIAAPTTTGPVQFGVGFASAIDEVAIYPVELDAAVIARHYAIGTGTEACPMAD